MSLGELEGAEEEEEEQEVEEEEKVFNDDAQVNWRCLSQII